MTQPASVLPDLYAQLERLVELSAQEREELRRGLMAASKARDPQTRGWACNGLAELARDRLDFDDALSWQRQAALLCPSDLAMHNNLGITLMSMGRPEDAVTPLLQAVELSKEQSWQGMLNLARAFSLLGDSEGALEMFERAQELVTRDDRRSWLAVASGAAELGFISEALTRVQGMELTNTELLRHVPLCVLLQQRSALSSEVATVSATNDEEDSVALDLFEATRPMRGRANQVVLGRKDG